MKTDFARHLKRDAKCACGCLSCGLHCEAGNCCQRGGGLKCKNSRMMMPLALSLLLLLPDLVAAAAPEVPELTGPLRVHRSLGRARQLVHRAETARKTH